ncbi:hypothetical protein AW736_05245 [Termitidicoccus mucosus]|uniref:Secretin/TonB short N-terminal domain-containing protein n=2 Tax=Termitidicoccus mucosus TaxID=1184151 RepID=A0A178IPB2_9BACT|nr:hypothetical protein AW736_05245 [Opitutaceae bacterium TSB47]
MVFSQVKSTASPPMPGGKTFLIACLFAYASASVFAAQEPDYFSDPILARTRVNIASTQVSPTALGDILALIEKQTGIELIYLDKRIPLTDRILVESDANVSLAHLLSSITTLTGVTFARHDRKMVVRIPMKAEAKIRITKNLLTDK